jgi:predicted restriction endonuclease
VRLPGDEPPWKATAAPVVIGKTGAPGQTETVTRRTLRDTKVTRWVKRQHEDACQICGKAVDLGNGALYSEGAHIRPLGRPHEGSDSSDNVLCLCPECHVLFDYGVLFITAGGLVFDTREARTVGSLRTTASHHLDPAQITYHRSTIAGHSV